MWASVEQLFCYGGEPFLAYRKCTVKADISRVRPGPLSQWVTLPPGVLVGEQSSGHVTARKFCPLSARGGVPSKGENPRFGKISPVCVFKSPLGHSDAGDFP